MRKKRFDLAVLLAAGGFYLVNRLWLSWAVGGPAGWFLSCYANDIFAGAAIVAWTDLLLRWGRLPPVRSWRQTAPLLLACGWGCGPKEQSDPGKDVDMAALAQAMKVAQPDGKDCLNPGQSATRGDAAVMLLAFMQR